MSAFQRVNEPASGLAGRMFFQVHCPHGKTGPDVGLHLHAQRNPFSRCESFLDHWQRHITPPSVELAPQFNIRVTSLQPGAVESELFEHISDKNYRAQMEQLKEKMTFLKADDVADSIPYVLQAPEHVNVAELFIMPPEQPW
ncbi:hypothetical protein AAHD50_06905 [Enterobacter hormaechei]|uniref:hypothetical protein n=1 Tax=Enterobacter hormaechei TaxID=158836 RepID=UPI00207566B7|nr:hypothetical protein [Enterobacter hormaechei]MCM8278980.1 hypothetical protein [Enterobacter hormaechei]MCM8283838.1 hypothetical protein [Enterobacter hormaechei]MDA4719873.1 hypothetical protein [Enterobacter hormaechei]